MSFEVSPLFFFIAFLVCFILFLADYVLGDVDTELGLGLLLTVQRKFFITILDYNYTVDSNIQPGG